MEDADAVLVRSAAMHDLELPDGLYAVARAGAGVNNIPLDKCAEKGIVVFNTPGANANGVKELVIAGMLLASRDIIGGVEWAKSEAGSEDIAKKAEKEKKKFAGCELMGKKLGIIGLGAIGIQVANVAERLGMDVYGYDPYLGVLTQGTHQPKCCQCLVYLECRFGRRAVMPDIYTISYIALFLSLCGMFIYLVIFFGVLHCRKLCPVFWVLVRYIPERSGKCGIDLIFYVFHKFFSIASSK